MDVSVRQTTPPSFRPWRRSSSGRRTLSLPLPLLLLLPLLLSPAAALGPPPNVVYLLADDLGHADVGFTDHPPVQADQAFATPHIDELARGATVLTRFQAMALCGPSRASLLSGRDPHRMGYNSYVQCPRLAPRRASPLPAPGRPVPPPPPRRRPRRPAAHATRTKSTSM